MTNRINTVSDLFSVLKDHGGAPAFFGVTPQRAWNWKAANRLPPALFMQHRTKLETVGIKAPDTLWFAPEPVAEAAS